MIYDLTNVQTEANNLALALENEFKQSWSLLVPEMYDLLKEDPELIAESWDLYQDMFSTDPDYLDWFIANKMENN